MFKHYNITRANFSCTAAFNYHFNALEGGGDGELSQAFENLL
jgi:hypothetical protein